MLEVTIVLEMRKAMGLASVWNRMRRKVEKRQKSQAKQQNQE